MKPERICKRWWVTAPDAGCQCSECVAARYEIEKEREPDRIAAERAFFGALLDGTAETVSEVKP